MIQDDILIIPQQVLIECVLTPNGGNTLATNPFDEQNYLMNRPIIGLQVFSASDLAFSPLGKKLAVIPDALLPYAFMNIQRAGTDAAKAGQWYKNIPLCTMRNVFNLSSACSANLDMFRVEPMQIQWRDTNISFPTSQRQDAPYSVPILVTFLLQNQDTKLYTQGYKFRQ